ncbi:hypothetical protein DIPPA_64429 [Diplonema papillatum]|nr:hypothetical protein DIPPA_64429 [Diplonema papillatum]
MPPKTNEWEGWSGREDVKWVVEGGARLRMVGGNVTGIEYRTLSGDLLRVTKQCDELWKERKLESGASREKVAELWFENGIPVDDRPVPRVSRAVSKRLTELAIETGCYMNFNGYSAQHLRRHRSRSRRSSFSDTGTPLTPPPPPPSGRLSPRDWPRPWRSTSRSRSAGSRTPSPLSPRHTPYFPSSHDTYGRVHSTELHSAPATFTQPQALPSRLSPRLHYGYSDAYLQHQAPSPWQSPRSHHGYSEACSQPTNVWQTRKVVLKSRPHSADQRVSHSPFCPHCGQSMSSRPTPFCPQTGARHVR